MRVNWAFGQLGLGQLGSVISAWSYKAYYFQLKLPVLFLLVCWSVNLDYITQRIRLHNGSIRKTKNKRIESPRRKNIDINSIQNDKRGGQEIYIFCFLILILFKQERKICGTIHVRPNCFDQTFNRSFFTNSMLRNR